METKNQPSKLEISQRGYESKMEQLDKRIRSALEHFAFAEKKPDAYSSSNYRYTPSLRVAALAALIDLEKLERKDEKRQIHPHSIEHSTVRGSSVHDIPCQCADCHYQAHEAAKADEGTEGDESSETDEGTALDHGVYQ